jgi:DNA-binding response OmpR family regulator
MLDVYIYKLRQKFGKDHIQTRRGMGYQLTP